MEQQHGLNTVSDDINFYCWVSTGIKYLSGMYFYNRTHTCFLVDLMFYKLIEKVGRR
jgi:hypothetical protein